MGNTEPAEDFEGHFLPFCIFKLMKIEYQESVFKFSSGPRRLSILPIMFDI